MTDTKVIMAYGDSLTLGADAEHDARHAYEDRWPTVLERGLGGKARMIAEGLGGRTTAFDDFSAADRNGARILPTMLSTHSPLDLVILFLGTNDLKPYMHGTAFQASLGIKRLVEIIRYFPYNRRAAVPKIVIVSPPFLGETEHPEFGPMFSPDGIAESRLFAKYYARAADQLGCGFFDAATVATVSPFDGIHLDAGNTRAIGEGLVPVVKRVLGL
ncbi:MAG: SGNH/GDSL hydrolase family protein [Devosia sp.]|nr:SGNH/GDSL hydrolase family protein [Devosia sp.]